MAPSRRDTSARLRTFASKIDRETNEILTPQDWLPCSVFAATTRPARVLVFPRDALVRRLSAARLWPRDWAAVVRYGVPPAWLAKVIADRCAALGVEPSFVGDLDPLDLHIFHAYRNCDPWLGGRKRLPFHFLGVDDRWIQLGRRLAKPGYGSSPSTSRMDKWEREHMALLAAVDLESVVGPESMALLRAGRKIEVEGASSEALFGPTILKRILALLRRCR